MKKKIQNLSKQQNNGEVGSKTKIKSLRNPNTKNDLKHLNYVQQKIDTKKSAVTEDAKNLVNYIGEGFLNTQNFVKNITNKLTDGV